MLHQNQHKKMHLLSICSFFFLFLAIYLQHAWSNNVTCNNNINAHREMSTLFSSDGILCVSEPCLGIFFAMSFFVHQPGYRMWKMSIGYYELHEKCIHFNVCIYCVKCVVHFFFYFHVQYIFCSDTRSWCMQNVVELWSYVFN